MSITRSPYTPPIGSQVRFGTCGTVATVTGYTDRGFTYKDGPALSIPRLGIQGTGEGECYTDVPEWDSYVIQFEPKVETEAIKHDQFEPMKLIAVTERLRAWSKGNFGPTLAQVREDIKWLLDSHLYYYQKTQELDKAYWGAGCKEAPMSWRDRAEEAEKKLKKIEEIFNG